MTYYRLLVGMLASDSVRLRKELEEESKKLKDITYELKLSCMDAEDAEAVARTLYGECTAQFANIAMLMDQLMVSRRRVKDAIRSGIQSRITPTNESGKVAFSGSGQSKDTNHASAKSSSENAKRDNPSLAGGVSQPQASANVHSIMSQCNTNSDNTQMITNNGMLGGRTGGSGTEVECIDQGRLSCTAEKKVDIPVVESEDNEDGDEMPYSPSIIDSFLKPQGSADQSTDGIPHLGNMKPASPTSNTKINGDTEGS